MDFLYFPEDKSEYILPLILLFIFVIGAIATVYLFYKKSKKEDEQPRKEYPKHIVPESDDKDEK